MSIGDENGNTGPVVLDEIEDFVRTISATLVVTAMRANENRWATSLRRSVRISVFRYIDEKRLLFA